jgi:hypothetical protein
MYVIVDVIRRQDRGKDGLSSCAAVDLVLEVAPYVTSTQTAATFRNSIRRKFRGTITNIVKAQQTTPMCSEVTVG